MKNILESGFIHESILKKHPNPILCFTSTKLTNLVNTMMFLKMDSYIKPDSKTLFINDIFGPDE